MKYLTFGAEDGARDGGEGVCVCSKLGEKAIGTARGEAQKTGP